MDEREVNCTDCLVAIKGVDTKLSLLNSNIMKIVYALLGVIGANIGTKYIGTPIHVEIAMYTLFFSAIFVTLVTISNWKYIPFWEKASQIMFVLLSVWVTGLRIHHYQVGASFTQNEGVVTQALMTGMALGFIISGWKRYALRKSGKRRCEDVIGRGVGGGTVCSTDGRVDAEVPWKRKMPGG